jgi:hypothetical protein
MGIWYPLLVVPIAMLADQSIAFALVHWSCVHQQPMAVHGVHALFLAAAVAGIAMAWHALRAAAPANGGEAPARRRFTAGIALASSVLSALVIATMWLAVFLVAPCIA